MVQYLRALKTVLRLSESAHAMAEEETKTLAAGCDGHLTKPLKQGELVETISRHTKRLSIEN